MKRIGLARFAVLAGVALVAPHAIAAQSVAVGEATPSVDKTYPGADIKELFAAVEASYKKAGIPVTERDPDGFSIGNPAFAADKKIFNLNLEKIFDCGGDKKAPAAARANLVLSVVTRLVKTDEGVRVRSSLAASGTVMTDAGPVAAHCTSLEALEKRLQPDPLKLKCGSTGSTFVTTVITAERAPASAGPIRMTGFGSNCLPVGAGR